RDERGGRTEDLLGGDAHVALDPPVDRRPVEEALLAVREVLAAREDLGALVAGDAGVAVDLVARGLVDERAYVDLGVEAVADRQALRRLEELRREAVLVALVHDHATGRGAALDGRPERA